MEEGEGLIIIGGGRRMSAVPPDCRGKEGEEKRRLIIMPQLS